jgi:hypothetical protein
MKKQILFVILLSSHLMCYSQQVIPQTLLYKDTISYFYALQDSVIKMKLVGWDKKTDILINDRLLTTIKDKYGIWGGKNISANDRTRMDVIFDRVQQINRLSLVTGKIDTILAVIPHSESYSVVIGNLLIGAKNTATESVLISYNIETNQQNALCEIQGEDHSIWGIDASITGILLLHFGNNIETEYIDYYVYNVKNNQLSKKDYSKYLKDHEEFSFSHDDITGRYMILGAFWVDTSFDIVQPTLKRGGLNAQRGFKLKESDSYYYLKSEIDAPLRKSGSTDVWLPCRFTLPFDLCLYKIYNNQLLTKEEIAGFDQWELHKLKNMVFAKHNYQFESHYLQAFYNLFQFYKGSVKDVNNLLTTEDQENLKLINQLMK